MNQKLPGDQQRRGVSFTSYLAIGATIFLMGVEYGKCSISKEKKQPEGMMTHSPPDAGVMERYHPKIQGYYLNDGGRIKNGGI